ncbi:trypsin-like peptidase domain-containing protein [Rubellicoccus peritrichatus]|uniref:Trypsin-like peptidase domain-containing protein n=1 Tax=Rubellicoccus peritrichatus TaxID=3080537 RepID=A0AAQ3QQI0_9BACT|nr:trypsin-like peptidase domain-containing protein [Puniceicoccus sp. CR14]WOO40268.1 trypsin-like peptidase domain-containing protein [Puniceicoccus sp. CR14]
MLTENTYIHRLILCGLLIMLGSACVEAAPRHARSSFTVEKTEPGFQNLLNSVVRLDVWETVFKAGREQTAHGVGSGVIMTDEGYILTNAHVVNPYAERIWATLNNLERVPATLVGWDHWTDLAVIKLDVDELKAKDMDFSWGKFGDSSKLIPGETVYAVGTPNGLARTVTRGIISNTNRFFEGAQVGRGYETGYFNTWLQTDAAINPGNSGGPLVLPDGDVIGINTRGYLGANNLGFAVPSNIAKRVMEELIEKGSVTRSYTGIVPGPMQDLEEFFDVELNKGMLVQSIDPGSPAEDAGLRPSDIILTIDGTSVDGRFPEQLPEIQKRIAERPVGSTILIDVKRGDEVLPLVVTTEELQSRVGHEAALEDWGISVQKVSRAVAREQQLKSSDGVYVVGTQRAFPAAEAGIRSGDIITSVNRKPIVTLEDLEAAYEQYVENPDRVLMEITRNHQVSFVVMKP